MEMVVVLSIKIEIFVFVWKGWRNEIYFVLILDFVNFVFCFLYIGGEFVMGIRYLSIGGIL